MQQFDLLQSSTVAAPTTGNSLFLLRNQPELSQIRAGLTTETVVVFGTFYYRPTTVIQELKKE